MSQSFEKSALTRCPRSAKGCPNPLRIPLPHAALVWPKDVHILWYREMNQAWCRRMGPRRPDAETDDVRLEVGHIRHGEAHTGWS